MQIIRIGGVPVEIQATQGRDDMPASYRFADIARYTSSPGKLIITGKDEKREFFNCTPEQLKEFMAARLEYLRHVSEQSEVGA